MPSIKDLMGAGIPALPATLLGGAITLDGNITLTQTSTSIVANSADAADSYRLDIAAGGAIADQTRGAFITMSGNENAATGSIDLGAGNTATSMINLILGNASGEVRIKNNSGNRLWYFGNGGDLTVDATNGGNLVIARAGKGLQIKEGSNARMGTATLVGGTIAVANTSVTASTRVIYCRSTTGGTAGHLSTTQSAGVSFTITSSSGTDTSTCVWMLVEPSA